MTATHDPRPSASTFLVATGVALGGGLVLGSVVLVTLAGVLGWIAAAKALPHGGLTAAAAVFLLWTNAAVIAAGQVGGPSSFGALPQLLLASVVIGRVFVHQRPLVVTAAFRALLIHGAALVLAALVALDTAPVQGALLTFAIEGVLLWLLAINAIDDRRDFERVMLAIVLACAFLGALSLVQFATRSYGNDYFGFAQIEESRLELLESGESSLPRLSGPLGEKNRYAQTLLVVIPIAIGLTHARPRRAAPVLVALVPITGGVALTGSRGAIVGLIATLAVAGLMRLVSLRSLGIIALGAVLMVTSIPGYRDRILNTIEAAEPSGTESVDTSTLSRLATNLAALHMFQDHPLLGVGPDGFPRMYESYAERVGLNVKDEARQPHNLYLGVAAELGIVGLVTFLAMPLLLLMSLTRSWRLLRLRDPPTAALAASLVAAIIAYLSSGIFLHLAFDRYYWLLLALCDAGARVARRSAREITPGTSANGRPTLVVS